ncbi:MAG: chemotaxis protein methyltransferase WspC [Chthoniobacter sp.]|jgi:chemotaxis protein methyltransferase WspC|nr:chemotaxis protein methyltransferase WspC [Chthoniobacter sp.]
MSQSHIANLLKQAIGVDAATIGLSVIDHAVRSRMAACKVSDLGVYWERLRHSPPELAQLTEAVVVPETWFFRDAESYAALAQIVLNEWAPAHLTGRLRILSAPCSTGEEPYTIAMALLDAGLPPHRFQIDAIDISARALGEARRAIYGRNSFRGHELSYRDRFFRASPQGYELIESVRERVEFQPGNLVADDLLPGIGSYDIVFCRNVLIYFDGATQERVIRTLDRLLAPEGVLFVGPAEAFITRTSGFSSAKFPSAFACRKSKAAPAPPPWAPPAVRTKAPPVRRTAPQAVSKSNAAKIEPAPAPAPKTDLEAASLLADAGRLAEAGCACEAHLQEHGPSVAAFYLLALVRDSLGDAGAAIEYYRKVLYLDPNHPEALLHLALLAEKQGDAAGARRLQLRARRSEEAASEGESHCRSGGLPAAATIGDRQAAPPSRAR